MPDFTTFIHCSIESSRQSNKATIRNKRHANLKKMEVKLSICKCVILDVENPKDSPKTVRINKFSKVARCKINIQKSGAFLYTNNEQSEKEN